MSLYINVNKIDRVLLADHSWYVCDRIKGNQGEVVSSFDLDSYEFYQAPPPYRAELDYDHLGEARWEERGRTLLGGGEQDGVPATGFTFLSQGKRISGPLTAVLAVAY